MHITSKATSTITGSPESTRSLTAGLGKRGPILWLRAHFSCDNHFRLSTCFDLAPRQVRTTGRRQREVWNLVHGLRQLKRKNTQENPFGLWRRLEVASPGRERVRSRVPGCEGPGFRWWWLEFRPTLRASPQNLPPPAAAPDALELGRAWAVWALLGSQGRRDPQTWRF